MSDAVAVGAVCPSGTFRDPTVLEAIHAAVPELAVPVFAAVTRLGNPVWVAGLGIVIYLLGPRHREIDRQRGAHLVAAMFGGVALITAVKFGLACPRPPTTFQYIAADGFGFPSGHATAAALGYGLIAVVLPWRSRRVAVGIAVGLALLVSLSRVALGVHYPIDVLAGLALGGGYVVGIRYVTESDPSRTFAITAVIGTAAGVIAWPTIDATAAIGGSLGAMLAWWWGGQRGATAGLAVPLFGLLVAIAAAGVVEVFEPRPIVAVGVFFGAGAGLVALPTLPTRLEIPERIGPWERS